LLAGLTENGLGSPLLPTQNELIIEHLALVKYHAYRFASQLPPNVEINDLISAGVLGLIDAAGKFDPSRGVQFKTYADVRIRGAMIDGLRALDWAPQMLRRKGKKLREAAEKLQRQLGREAGEQEICNELSIGLEELHKLHGRLHGLTIGNLRETGGGLGEQSPDSYPDDTTDGPHLQYLKEELKSVLTHAVDQLGPKERLVVSLYYFDELTMKEIAAVLDVNESRVSQIHTKAMTQLRRKLKNSGYQPVSNSDNAVYRGQLNNERNERTHTSS
jgi:RNA polymerase sigma factor for flagellar operon FliA